MNNYINDIAKINKYERLKAIIKVLKENNISYHIQGIPINDALGNIIVEFNPNNDKAIVVSAHYDNAYNTYGANDNASACSILLNLIINNKNSSKHLKFIFFDLEEKGFIGSNYYLNTNKNDFLYAINLDMCGIGENIVYSYNGKTLDPILNKYNAIKVKELPPGDATSFILKNIETLYIINSTNHDLNWFYNYPNDLSKPDFIETMHKITDSVDKINLKQVEKIYMLVNEIINNAI